MGDSQIAGVWTRLECRLHINVLEFKAVILAFQHFIAVLQGHHVLIAMDYTTVVAYINKQGGSHCHALLRLVVDLFLWLQTQDITLGARHIPCCLNVIADRLSWPNQPITTEWSLYPTSSSVYVSSSGTSSTGDRYPVTGLAGEVDVHVSTVSPAQQSHSEAQDHSGELLLKAPWWPSQPWFPHLLRLCVDHPHYFPYRQDLLSQQGYISSFKLYHQHACRLSCITTKQQDF